MSPDNFALINVSVMIIVIFFILACSHVIRQSQQRHETLQYVNLV